MSTYNPRPTPYPDVNAIASDLLLRVQRILAEQFVGMYLDGSLASGDFDPHRSDIDFIVVTSGALPDEILSALRVMHQEIEQGESPWAKKLEGAYIPQPTIRRYNPGGKHPTLEMGEDLSMGQDGPDWLIHRHVLREGGIVLAGPSPQELIDHVGPGELRQAVVALLQSWWSLMLCDPKRLLGPGYQPYAVLTMCRALYGLQHGTIVSKPFAARWALDSIEGRWESLIRRALADEGDTQPESIKETQAFIRYTLQLGAED